ncbi:MAG TPA: hypothetical protein VF357_07310, partial [Candidatus Deferrimicrobium sp.]
SDRLANVGVTNRGALRERAGDIAEKGISVSTFVVGNAFDEELLTMVAGGGGGNYRYLGDPERTVAALESEFHTVSRTAASEVEIILRLKRECPSARSSGATGGATATPTSSGWAIFPRASVGPSSPS